MTLRIHLLGSTQISRDDVSVNIPGNRPLALLAYLLVTGKAHSRQHLVDLLFDGPDDPRAALRWTLSKLRQAIGTDYILADRQQIAFNDESDYWLDVTGFEGGQLDLYRGDFLEGLHLREAFAFEDWLIFERERLRGCYQAALEQQLLEVESQGDDVAIIETTHQLLRLDNLREDWYRTLMRAYARQGKREAALAQFEQCRQVLQAELGVEPITETVNLAEAIRQGRFEPLRPDPQSKTHLIAGRYIIDDLDKDLLGQGNMGQVYKGRDTQTNQAVAIKVIKPDIIASQPHLVERFIREGEALRQLNHPNIVKMLAATEEEGRHYLMMEYVEGGSLEDLLKSQGPLPLERTLEIALDLADALTRAHRLDIIHRDLKPANVLLAKDGTPRLADFGIARLGSSPQLTQTGIVMGTVDYLSPEACEGKRLDSRTDIWAFGILIYEMLTGHRPFMADSLAARLAAILTQPVPDLTEQRPEVPDALASLIHRMLEKEPEQRVPSIRLVGAELEAILQGRGVEEQRSKEEVTPVPLPPRIPTQQRPRFPTSLVGRAAEMDTLRQAWQRVVEGRGQIVLIEGEPGIGKTRLVEELLAEVAQQAVILRVKCPELQDPLAYTLFVDPLRKILLDASPSLGGIEGGLTPNLSDTWLAEVSRLLPELRDRYPNLPQPDSLDPAAERRRLFDAVCATLLALTTQRPLVLFEDDLQWADATSLELLNHLSGRIAEAPVLILGTYRSNEVGPDHPLQGPRRDWQRVGLLTELSLEPLSDEAVADLLRELTTWPGDDRSFGELVYRETAGNPLFVVETIASLRDEGRLPQDAEGWLHDFRAESVTIPAQVQTLIETRLNRLDELSRQVGTTAAVMRGSFTAEVVQTVSGRNEWETLDGLEQLLEAGLLVEQGAEQFSFSHDKIREVAYHSLSQLRRKLLHRRVAETLEKGNRGRENTIADRLAHHYERAGDSEKALAYHTQAGDRAREQYAHEAAIDHYEKVVTYLKEQEDYDSAAQLLMKLGLLYHNIFDFERARQAYEEGFALRQKAGGEKPAPLPSALHALRLVVSNPVTLDPAMASDLSSSTIIDQLFSGLVEQRPEMEVVPDIGQSWEMSADGNKYVFHLRNDVRWSDGVPVTAADFEFAWRRVLDPNMGSPNASLLYDIKGARAFHEGKVSDPDQVGVRALDEVTLEVELEEPTSYFLQLLAQEVTYALPRHVVEAHGQAWTELGHIITNGPFRLEAWQRERSIVLRRNPEYRGRFTGNVQRVELRLGVAPSAELELYEVEDLDIDRSLWKLPTSEIDRALQRYVDEHISGPDLTTQYIGFNVSRPPFDDLRVRQAFVLAIDRERLVDVAYGGHHFPATGGFIPPGMPGHSAQLGLPYDPDQARQLLARAGYAQGCGFPGVEWLTTPIPRAMFEYVQAQWQENLGIEIERQTTEWGMLLERLNQEPPHLFQGGWTADYPDPDNFLRASSMRRETRWRNRAYDSLVKEAKRVPDRAQRMKLYQQADRILIEEAVVLPLLYQQIHMLLKPWVSEFPTSPIKNWFWKDVIIEPHDPQPTASPPASRTLRTTGEGEPHTLDPTSFSDTTSLIIIGQLFRGLITETPDMEFVPDVAQRWEIVDEGRKYIFHLRSDVVWSDGTPVTATDFEYAWKRALNPASGSLVANMLYDVKGARAFHQGQVSNPDSVGISAPNKHTLVIELERPASYFLNLLAVPNTFPIPHHIVEAHGESWTAVENIVTNGPFTLEAWRKGEMMSLRRNRAYHGLFSGNLERVELFFSGDDVATELAWYEAGRLDVTRQPPLNREAKQQYGSEYITLPNFSTYQLAFDNSRPPFADPRVRRAFILATDRQGMPDHLREEFGLPAMGGLCPLGMPGHSAGIGLPYDPVQARQLLAEAGYPEGHNFPEISWLMAEVTKPLAGYLQEQWQTNLGVHRFNKESASWGTLQERAKQKRASLLLAAWAADYPDPDNFLRVCLQYFLPGWRNETFDRLVEQAGRMTDSRKRLELYQQADKILIEDAVLMPLTYGRYPLLVKPWVKQHRYAPHRRVFWQDVIIETH